MPAWGIVDSGQRERVRWAVKGLDHLLTHDVALALDEIDVLRHLNKNVEKTRKLNLSQLRVMIGLCSSIEYQTGEFVRGKFEQLKGRGNQVERLLVEFSRPMSIQEIVRELNYRLVRYERRKVAPQTLVNQLSQDERFVNQGRSGFWGLKSWPNINLNTVKELMEQCLMEYNHPLSLDEIYAYVSARRPVSKKSILMYLNTEKQFAKISRVKWGLAVWPETRNAVVWNPEQVADFVAETFRAKGKNELEFRVVRLALMEAAGVSSKVAIGMLQTNPAIKTRKGDKSNDRYAILQSNYKDILSKPRTRPKSHKPTLFQQVDEAVHTILEQAPDKQVALADLISELQKKFAYNATTLYSYIGRLEYIERIDVPGSKTRICHLKGASTLVSFPQVAAIKNETLRAKIDRTLAFLNEDYVDIGLFLLGKEFEATLKAYLVVGISKEKIVSKLAPDPDKWKLVNMVDCLEGCSSQD